MTFQKTAYAIDGALLTSSLVRRAHFASTGGGQGVVQPGDLKVTQLDVPGVGVQIAPGVGLVLNDYQTKPNETYTVSNPGVHVVPSGEMPAANPAAKSYIVAVVIGDPEFSQTGHPWMLPSDPPAGEELAFDYVRVTLIEVSAGATDIPGPFPALPLARIDIPANTTTIVDSMITNLATLAQNRSAQDMLVSGQAWASSPVLMSNGTYADWGNVQYTPSIKIPSWARRCVIAAMAGGVQILDSSVNIGGGISVTLGSKVSPTTWFDVPSNSGGIRVDLFIPGTFDVSDIAGTSQPIKLRANQSAPSGAAANRRLRLTAGTQVTYDVRFFED